MDENVVKPNPIRDSANKLKLSIFGMNGGGASFTFHPDRFSGDCEATARLAKRADELGIEGFVSASRWHPFGGDGHYSGDVMETLSWAGAVASITERISVISTVPITLVNPAFVGVRQTVVLDRELRSRERILHGQKRDFTTASPAVPAGPAERGRLTTRPPLRGPARRSRLHHPGRPGSPRGQGRATAPTPSSARRPTSRRAWANCRTPASTA
ncbi:LLM class flavin-dependent oxidoreductase [Amycolatopsis carbonis]|uniref:LLM class flavin-dependent oxidoreductase n=1 Tax=Amycolatopsis carbonis TaxID=715471 RepID=UPI003DA711A2